MISIDVKGNFDNTDRFLSNAKKASIMSIMDKYGRAGVSALSHATPVDTGKTASSWSYDIVKTGSGLSLIWTNSNINEGANIAILIQYGHGVHGGGYVQGYDYINPALRPVFDDFAEELWKEVNK